MHVVQSVKFSYIYVPSTRLTSKILREKEIECIDSHILILRIHAFK